MFIKLIRLGKDSELRTTPQGKQVLNFSGAYDVGFGDNKRTQWIECALWGERGAKVQQYLVKGCQAVIYGDNLEVEAYNKNDSDRTAGATLKCDVQQFDFAGGNNDGVSVPVSAPAPQAAPAPVPMPPQAGMTDAEALVKYQQCTQPESVEMWATLSPSQQAYIANALA